MRKPEMEVDRDLLVKMGYEPRDIALNTILRWVFFLFVFIFLTLCLSLGIYALFVPAATEIGKNSPLTYQRALPPNPQLQAYPKRDMMYWRQAEDALVAGVTKDPGTGKPVMSVDQAIETMATERGIAGIKGNKLTERGPAYPGSGRYETGEARADNTGANDTTSAETNNRATQNGAPGAGGTQEETLTDPNISDRVESPGGSIMNAGQGAAQQNAARGEGEPGANPGSASGTASDPARNGGVVPAPTGGLGTTPGGATAPPGSGARP